MSRSSLALFLAAAPASLLAQSVRPNIVYIMTDDHTAQMMSCYDTRFVSTPNLDRIAADGVRFTHSFVANSLSGPSRACMLTGKHSHKNGFTNNEHGIFDGSQQTMPKLLRAAGYETCLIGKWHLVSTPTGFDHWEILPAQAHASLPTKPSRGWINIQQLSIINPQPTILNHQSTILNHQSTILNHQ